MANASTAKAARAFATRCSISIASRAEPGGRPPLWKACYDFCHRFLGAPAPWHGVDTIRAVLLGLGPGNPPRLLDEAPRAFLRHALGAYYAHATKVQTDGTVFCWQRVFHRALVSFRSAVYRYCRGIRLHYIRRKYTDLTGIIPEVDRLRFSQLATIEPNGTYELTSPLTDAVHVADAAKRLEETRGRQNVTNKPPPPPPLDYFQDASPPAGGRGVPVPP